LKPNTCLISSAHLRGLALPPAAHLNQLQAEWTRTHAAARARLPSSPASTPHLEKIVQNSPLTNHISAPPVRIHGAGTSLDCSPEPSLVGLQHSGQISASKLGSTNRVSDLKPNTCLISSAHLRGLALPPAAHLNQLQAEWTHPHGCSRPATIEPCLHTSSGEDFSGFPVDKPHTRVSREGRIAVFRTVLSPDQHWWLK
jgi:hypothetical protein